jgi:prepilin-type N-terminal cleavage/methylation domain-containing protein
VARPQRGFTIVELLIAVAIVGIIAAIAIPSMMTAVERARQKRTLIDMRSIAMAWEARANDMSKYNAAATGYLGADQTADIDNVAEVLQPTYIQATPTTDGWRHKFDVFLDAGWGTDHGATRYVIASPGRDGVYNPAQPAGAFTNFDCDIVYSNGSFYMYPATGVQ